MNQLLIIVGVAAVYMTAQIGWMLAKKHLLRKYWMKGQEALKAGLPEQALPMLRRCTKLAPTWTAARAMLAMNLASLGKVDEGEQQMRLAAELTPRDIAGFKNLCMFYAVFCPGKTAAARAALAKVRELDPDGVDAFLQEPRMRPLQDMDKAE